ncbi:sodium-coupled monocarboxylate transporter 1 [Arctopsyche grandis]|uniref:sodium-coupled monocarboxylate transporter 1 n=1 Tax=Arctopsyche grandis TaxID=121162 RepID=UPI00406D9068
MAMEPSSLIVDYIVFLVFIIGSSLLPFWSKTKTPQTKANYVFAAGGSVSTAAMMLSIARGTLGVRSFLGFPSELFYKGSAMWETLYGMIFAYPIVSFVFVPIYYSLGITSVYQYLDLRFKSRTVRCLASATYIWRQVLNLGVTVFTPCVALNTVIGLPYWASILGITVISILFNSFGGLGAAIKADVIQGVTMILISMAIIIQCAYEVGGPVNMFTIPAERGRLKFFDFKWDLNVRVDTMSAWVGQMFMSLSLYGCQQNFVQRYCSMKSEKKVRKTLLWNIPMITVLFSLSWIVGMGIYSIYSSCDPLTAGYTKKMDEILPFFMEDKFSYFPGVMGLFMGSLFNGALSISVSQLNSLATVTWEDFLSQAPAFKNLKDRQQLTIIKILGAVYGIIIMGISFGVGLLSGVIESNMLMTSATSGPLLGVFVLAMLIPCATKKGAIAGMVTSHVITMWITVGHLMYDQTQVETLPLSISGCTNTTFSAHIMKPGQQWPLPSPPLEVNINTTHFLDHFNHLDTTTINPLDTNPLKPLYLMTYMYYAMIGTLITVVVGVVVSLIFPLNDDDVYDEDLLHPLILKMSRWFPGKPRKYLKKDKNENNTSMEAAVLPNGEKPSKEIDNPVFEMTENINNHTVVIESTNNDSKKNYLNSDSKCGSLKKNSNLELGNHATKF